MIKHNQHVSYERIYVHIYVHAQAHAYVYTYVHINIHIYVNTHTKLSIYIHTTNLKNSLLFICLHNNINTGLHDIQEEKSNSSNNDNNNNDNKSKSKNDTEPLMVNTPSEAASLLIKEALKGVDLSSLAHVSEVITLIV